MENNLVKIATTYAKINEQFTENNLVLVHQIEQGNKQYQKMELYLKMLQNKLQNCQHKTPEQEKHLLEITRILNP